MATSTQEWIDELKTISVLELSERIKALEEAFGVSATAVAAAAPGQHRVTARSRAELDIADPVAVARALAETEQRFRRLPVEARLRQRRCRVFPDRRDFRRATRAGVSSRRDRRRWLRDEVCRFVFLQTHRWEPGILHPGD